MKCPCCSDLLVRQFRNGNLNFFCHTCWTDYPISQNQPRQLTPKDKAIKPLVSISTLSRQKQAKSHKREVLTLTEARNTARNNSLANQLNAS